MVRTCLPNHLRVLLRPPAVRAASGHQTDGAVAAADCQAVRRPGLHGQRLRMAAHAAKRPVHLPPPNEITIQSIRQDQQGRWDIHAIQVCGCWSMSKEIGIGTPLLSAPLS